ncbi:methionine--tRNA ligase [Canibacter sp. lx-72]|uniref:methionine--tRNA ligase n=1 Tax=Canibacter zhuwentaonis TaxID=2837491 RepID=UPI001BDC6B57|nr:methionine--tRNA ligase [Canibacter zhuwentaonis]MBT1018756.1 methionine--tRNA ligase [Canibacter zhuwentaonis]
MFKHQTKYFTTPIFYVNDAPHIGHAYTEVAADVLARWHRAAGVDTRFLTGTDEHGQKILRTAEANGASPKEWVDRLVAQEWRPMLENLNIANDDFIRTTDARHEAGVAKFLQRLYDKGYIYEGEFEALYCVGCEEFKPKSEIVQGAAEFTGHKVCAIHSKPLELLQEKNYFFKMSAFQDRLLELYERRPDFIQPAPARNEVIAFVQQDLTDLSISRNTFNWGVPIPWDESHVTYVWFDALLNYITALEYSTSVVGDEPGSVALAKYWPAVHIVGKDILRFHAVIWPAMLMAAELAEPECVFAHGWLLVGGEKMSKSKLTGIAPHEITGTFGVDAVRYYFMRAINFGQDGSFSWEDIAARYQAELANGFGNLVSRVLAMNAKYFDAKQPESGDLTGADKQISELAARVTSLANEHITKYAIHEAIAVVWQLVDALNGYITEQEPWQLAKDEAQRVRLATVLATATEGLRVLAQLLAPVIPEAAAKLWRSLGAVAVLGELSEQNIAAAGQWHKLPAGTPQEALPALFPRVELAAGVKK